MDAIVCMNEKSTPVFIDVRFDFLSQDLNAIYLLLAKLFSDYFVFVIYVDDVDVAFVIGSI